MSKREISIIDSEGRSITYINRALKAIELGVSTRTINRLVDRGKLKFFMFTHIKSPDKWYLKEKI